MKHLNRLLAVGSLCAGLAVLGVTGCSSTKKEAEATGRTPEQVKTDNAISSQVAKALETAPVYKYPQVHVSTRNGVVLLSGFVGTDAQKEEATKIAQQGSGGREVRNNLLVQPLPTGRTDQQPQGTQQQPPQNTPPAEPK